MVIDDSGKRGQSRAFYTHDSLFLHVWRRFHCGVPLVQDTEKTPNLPVVVEPFVGTVQMQRDKGKMSPHYSEKRTLKKRRGEEGVTSSLNAKSGIMGTEMLTPLLKKEKLMKRRGEEGREGKVSHVQAVCAIITSCA